MVLPSVHMSPAGGGAGRGAGRGDGGGARREDGGGDRGGYGGGDGGGDGVGSWRDRDLAAGQQWNRNSRHRMVDRWVDQVSDGERNFKRYQSLLLALTIFKFKEQDKCRLSFVFENIWKKVQCFSTYICQVQQAVGRGQVSDWWEEVCLSLYHCCF